jgi:hypothetical protein
LLLYHQQIKVDLSQELEQWLAPLKVDLNGVDLKSVYQAVDDGALSFDDRIMEIAFSSPLLTLAVRASRQGVMPDWLKDDHNQQVSLSA